VGDLTGGVQLVGNGSGGRELDVVFVHGLGGTPHTWTYQPINSVTTFHWPTALAEDLPTFSVWTVAYAAPIAAFAANPGMAIEDQATNLALRLCNAGLGAKPIVFVMHSLGGLVVKALCTQAHFGDKDIQLIASQVRGLVFCGTPHRGSAIANAARVLGNLTDRLVRQLEGNSDELNRAHRQFLAWHHSVQPTVEVQTYFETRGFAYRFRWLPVGRRLLVVSQTSADTGIVGAPMYPVAANHQELVKPSSRDSEIYGGVKRFLDGVQVSLHTKPVSSQYGALSTSRESPPEGSVQEIPSPSSSLGRSESVEPTRVPSNVPPPSGVFVGRAREVDRIRTALASPYSTICISGLGGFGKSALALEVVSRCLKEGAEGGRWPAFFGYVWISAKSGVLTFEDMLSSIATVLDQPSIVAQSPRDQQTEIDRVLRSSSYLVMLDNYESVTDARVVEFARSVPAPSKVLLTTRDSGPDSAFCVNVSGLNEYEYLELLTAEADRLQMPALARQDSVRLNAIYEATGGAPLAIKWVVAQLGQHGQTLDSVARALESARGDIFQEIFSKSWSLLTDASKFVLGLMPIFGSDTTRAAMQAVAIMGDEQLDDVVSELVGLNLVEPSAGLNDAMRRYSIHPLTRAFAQQAAFVSDADLYDANLRAASWFADFAARHLTGATLPDHLAEEIPNIMRAMRWSYDNNNWPSLARAAVALRDYLPDNGYWNEAVELGKYGVAACEAQGDRYHVGRLCVIPLGWIYRYQGDLDASQHWYEKGLDAFSEIGDLDRAAWVRLALANILFRRGAISEAERTAAEVRDSGAGDTPVRQRVVYTASLIHMSEMAHYRGDYITAERLAREARTISLETGYRNSTMSAAYWLGMANIGLGNLQLADAYLTESLQLNADGNVRMGTALCRAAIAKVRMEQGDPYAAYEHGRSAADLFQRLGMRKELADILPFLKLVEAQRQDPSGPVDRSASNES
jgi:tetratricopeptide (TPR) repeat protein/triacylglycerol esterase/lipase EstA (alpha/beta hydrolase family)